MAIRKKTGNIIPEETIQERTGSVIPEETIRRIEATLNRYCSLAGITRNQLTQGKYLGMVEGLRLAGYRVDRMGTRHTITAPC